MTAIDPLLKARFPALRQVQDDAGLAILSQAKPIELPADEVVFRLGDACQNYLFVVEGAIKVIGRSSEGREITLYRIVDCGTCVLTTSCLLANQHYPAEGVTESAVRAYALPRQQFQQALAESPALRRFIFDSYGQRLSALIGLVQEVAFERMDIRLARHLLRLGSHQDTLLLTHQSLATELGSAREVISRHLKEFERRGWISLGRGTLTLTDPQALSSFSGFF